MRKKVQKEKILNVEKPKDFKNCGSDPLTHVITISTSGVETETWKCVNFYHQLFNYTLVFIMNNCH